MSMKLNAMGAAGWGGTSLSETQGSAMLRVVVDDHDLRAIRRLRYDVNVVEQGKTLPWADHEEAELPAPGDEDALHVAIFEGDVPLCAARLQLGDAVSDADLSLMGLQGEVARLGTAPALFSKLVVRRGRRGMSWTRQLLAAVYRIGRERGALYSLGHCHPRLVPWYESMGMRVAGAPFLDPHVGEQVPMVIIGDDLEHFRAKRSFLAAEAERFHNDDARAGAIASAFTGTGRDSPPMSEAAPLSSVQESQSMGFDDQLLAVVREGQQRAADILGNCLNRTGLGREQYVRFLRMQFHLTRGVQRYFYAVAAHPALSRRKRLRAFLTQFANEEELHYLVAAADLAALGESPGACPLDVELWHSLFERHTPVHPFTRLGAAAVLENLSSGEAQAMVSAALRAPFLSRENTRFIAIHRHETLPHGQQMLDALHQADLDEHEARDALWGAQTAVVLYARMAKWAVEGDADSLSADLPWQGGSSDRHEGGLQELEAAAAS